METRQILVNLLIDEIGQIMNIYTRKKKYPLAFSELLL